MDIRTTYRTLSEVNQASHWLWAWLSWLQHDHYSRPSFWRAILAHEVGHITEIKNVQTKILKTFKNVKTWQK